MRVYEEIVDLIAGGVNPQQIVDFKPSAATRDRVADLIHREKIAGLSKDETDELNHFLQLEHIMRLARARARTHLKND
ncbi:MAG: hypothetical protein QNK37_29405 [Acidobacteriota bacterium]|nr:hypothetical protein [Acidobacteriota bacterium]